MKRGSSSFFPLGKHSYVFIFVTSFKGLSITFFFLSLSRFHAFQVSLFLTLSRITFEREREREERRWGVRESNPEKRVTWNWGSIFSEEGIETKSSFLSMNFSLLFSPFSSFFKIFFLSQRFLSSFPLHLMVTFSPVKISPHFHSQILSVWSTTIKYFFLQLSFLFSLLSLSISYNFSLQKNGRERKRVEQIVLVVNSWTFHDSLILDKSAIFSSLDFFYFLSLSRFLPFSLSTFLSRISCDHLFPCHWNVAEEENPESCATITELAE